MASQLRSISRLWFFFTFLLTTQNIWAQTISLTATNTPYNQDFNTLSNTAGSTTNTGLPTGFYLTETGGGARDNEQYAVDTGGSTTGDTYSYGSAAATDRAFGGLRSGTLIPVIGAAFTNNTTTTVTSLSITYTGEQWRLGTINRADQLTFEYSTNATDLTTGTYTSVATLSFSTPNQVTTGAKDGNIVANRTLITGTITGLSIPNGSTFWIRFTDVDASGADDGLAIDDFSLTALNVLPVKLTSFTGQSANKAVVLNWATAWEEKNEGFDILKGSSATSLEAVGFVAGKTTTQELSTYSFTDTDVKDGQVYYYQLRQKDIGGGSELSKIIAVRVRSGSEESAPMVYPNPNRGSFSVSANDVSAISLFNSSGVEIPVISSQTPGASTISVDVKTPLPTGVYHLRIQAADGTYKQSVKVVVQ